MSGKGKICRVLSITFLILLISYTTFYCSYKVMHYDIGIKSTYSRWNEMSETSEEWKVCSWVNESQFVDKKVAAVYYPERMTNYRDWKMNETEWKRLRLKLMTENLDGNDHLLIYKKVKPRDMMFSKQIRSEVEKITYQIDYQKSCAIMGNSGILLNSNCGREIDSHSLVVRMSLHPIANFSGDVGTKTNITYLNRNILRKIYTRLTAKNDLYHATLQSMAFLNDSILWYGLGLDGMTYYDGDGNESYEKYRYLARTLKRDFGMPIQFAFSLHSIKLDSIRLWGLGNPSSGYNVLTWALTACDRLDLYGFYPFHHDAYCHPVQHHYGEPNVTVDYPASIHRWREEYQQLVDLHRRGILRLVTGKCQP